MAKREETEISVSRRVLWIGAEAYPLNNIARATTVRVEPDRKKAAARFGKSLFVAAALAVGAATALRQADLGDSEREQYLRGVTITFAALGVLFLLQLLSVVLRRTYYALVIETAGTPRTALVTTEQALVHELVRKIMAAIDDPHMSFRQTVTNYYGQVGDNINVFGRNNTGKVGNSQ
ncbi:DUF6232 family protein [Streptomyces sp. NPDC089919]|uniref:DUF6232 family protein n=1 Tax=Streptomyces sp. NPDC089919 TaxID=3155188 RepID=UPI003430DC20